MKNRIENEKKFCHAIIVVAILALWYTAGKYESGNLSDIGFIVRFFGLFFALVWGSYRAGAFEQKK